MAINDVSYSEMLNCRQPVCYHEMRTDEKYKHVIMFLRAFLFDIRTALTPFVKAIFAISMRHDVVIWLCS